VLNPRSGSLTKLGIDRGRERVAVLCAANGLAATIAVLRGSRIGDRIKKEIVSRERSAPCFDIVIVGGGDGSVGTAASVLAGSEIPLGILPLGTRNHFARDLRVPLDLEGAVRLIASGRSDRIDVGEVNGRVFLKQFLARHLPAPGRRARPRQSPPPRSVDRGGARSLSRSVAAARLTRVKSRSGWRRPSKARIASCRDSVEIFLRRRRVRVAFDGESLVFRPPLHYRIRPRALRVILPVPAWS